MKLFYLLLFLIITGSLEAQNVANLAQANSFATQQQAAFEENKGQVWDIQDKNADYVKYHFQQKGIDIFMLPTGFAYQFTKVHYPKGYKAPSKEPLNKEEQELQDALREQIRTETYRMDMQLVGANPNPTILAEGKSKDYVQYYNRNALNVHSFKQLTYQEVYPGIDWVIYTTDKGLKYDFIVQPGADPNQIKLKFNHHEDLKINTDGSFTLSSSMGSITEQAPISFQGAQKVTTAFRLEEDVISFELANYDKTKVIKIDPNVLWASYYGNRGEDYGRSCAVDGNDNVYLVGHTTSTSNIATGGHQNSYGGGYQEDAFIVKFNSNGNRLWASYYGGNDEDYGIACAIDSSGNVYLVGSTESTSNITVGGFQDTLKGFADVFIVKFNTNGNRLWASYYGGNDYDFSSSCTLDDSGNIYFVGRTQSTSGLASGGHQNTYGGGFYDAFIAKFSSTGTRLWASYYGGSAWDRGNSCAIDSNGNVYLVGNAGSTNMATGGWYQNTFGGGYRDAFIAKFSSTGTLIWASYYGGSDYDTGTACAIDNNDNIYLVGKSRSTSNIATGGHQNTFGGVFDAYIVKFSSTGTRLWASYYGGDDDDQGDACAIDNKGNVYLVGDAESFSNMAIGGHQNTFGGGYNDAFIVKFDSSGNRLWASYYGGNDEDHGYSCAVDGSGYVYLVGKTESTANIAVGGHQNIYGGGYEEDAFIVKIDSGNCIQMTTIDTQVVCDSYTWIDGNTYTTNNNTATHTLTNINGCDSVVMLNLTINHFSTGTDTQIACDSFTWIDGNTYTTNNSSATDTLTNAAGCDSIVTLNLTINHSSTHSSTGTDTQTACDTYTWIDGNTYTSSNNSATYTLTNANGCDSVVTLNLTINTVDTTTSITGITISSNAVGAVYQWLDCNNNYIVITDSTNQSLSPSQNGDYAVMVTQNGCIDTSSCHTIIVVGNTILLAQNGISIYPNPTAGNVQVDFGQSVENAAIKVYSTNGKLIQQQTAIQGTVHTLELPQTTGLYILEIHTLQGPSYYKVIKK